ncbi:MULTISPECIES: hypothetical protein [Streptomyces]|uniref:hypothetical protein n=1 Tax=Streptomyces TaxID=1883 RepID=UPI0002FDE320|nr:MULTISPECIES: hypothetical protein [Streptomyces]MYS94788.1 hypothetical protein [Streptomyces sp. SID5464]
MTELHKRGKTYQRMAADCGFKRSVTWWNKMYWLEIKDPPEPGLFPHLAMALEVSERRVAEMVAEQWCGVRPDDEVPEHLRNIVQLLRGIDPEDVPAVEAVVDLLVSKHVAETTRGRRVVKVKAKDS